MDFEVEGRYFENSLHAFTFAQIQADRMQRPVQVHLHDKYDQPLPVLKHKSSWHATAYPSNYVRSHLVRENSPLALGSAA